MGKVNKQTPQQQLWKLLTKRQQMLVLPLLRMLSPQTQEDIALGLVAHIRFGVVRKFENPLVAFLYCELLNLVKLNKKVK